MTKKQLVPLHDNESRTGTKFIAEGFGRRHEQVIRLVKKYQKEFEKISYLELSITKGKTKNFQEYFLTYKQLLFLISLLKNNDDMVNIKRDIVKKGTIAAAYEILKNFDVEHINKRYVYAAIDAQGNVKIGISNNPSRRVKELSLGNANNLKLIFYREAIGAGYSDEVKLHNECEKFKIKSEWFTKDAIEVIK